MAEGAAREPPSMPNPGFACQEVFMLMDRDGLPRRHDEDRPQRRKGHKGIQLSEPIVIGRSLGVSYLSLRPSRSSVQNNGVSNIVSGSFSHIHLLDRIDLVEVSVYDAKRFTNFKATTHSIEYRPLHPRAGLDPCRRR